MAIGFMVAEKMSAIVNLRVFRSFPQYVSFRPISNFPMLLNKTTEVQNVDGKILTIMLHLSTKF